MAFCVYCGNDAPDTRDHVPSRVLLDEPFPENIPNVPACKKCNESFSSDEEYAACLIECAISGSVEPRKLGREKIRHILESRPNLLSRLRQAKLSSRDEKGFHIEGERIKRFILKLARGHAAFDLHSPQTKDPDSMWIMPLIRMTESQIEEFNTPPESAFLPEVGSRALIRKIELGDSGWIDVQPGRYRYLATADGRGVLIRCVLSEYLTCEVIWSNQPMESHCSRTLKK